MALFSTALSDTEWMTNVEAAILNAMGPPTAEGMVLLWTDLGGEPSPPLASWRGDGGYHMAFTFPRVTLADARARVLRDRLTTVSAAGLWTEATEDLFHDLRCADALGVGIGNAHAGLIAGRLLRQRTDHPAKVLANQRHIARVARTVSVALTARTLVRETDAADACEAILTPSGAVVHAVGFAATASALGVLREAVRWREGAHPKADHLEGSEVWSALVAGRWSLVDDWDQSGRRYIVAVRNDVWADTLRLNASEARTIELSILGRHPKQIASELNVSQSRAYAIHHSALDKLGARTMGDVISLARRLRGALLTRIPLGTEALLALGAPAAAYDLLCLTNAERLVAHDLLQGVPRREIARRRGSSLRTVTNQIRAIYQKLRISSRTELIAALR